MISAYLSDNIRSAEQRILDRLRATGGDQGVLMQRAAAGVAAAARAMLGRRYGSSVLLMAGSGNNGCDGLFAAARLAAEGVAVRVVATSEQLHPDGWAALRAAGGRRVEVDSAVAALRQGRFDLVIDAVLGIGGRPGLRGVAAQIATHCGSGEVGGTPVLAVDLPSGLVADSPTVPDRPVFRASTTVTFGGYKICHLARPAAQICGAVQLVDIGLDLESLDLKSTQPVLTALQPADVAAGIPQPGATADKYSRGVLGIDAGSPDYPGAGVLAHLGAANAGAGMIRSLGSDAVATAVLAVLPNVVRAEGRVQARLLGSGWGECGDAVAAVSQALDQGTPVVLDADAIGALPTVLAARAGGPLTTPCLLTPHAGELARLLNVQRSEVEADPIEHVRRAAEQTGATVLLKGASQYVAEPGSGQVWLAVPGPGWTAQAGSGDTLAGICGAYLAQGLTPRDAGLLGTSVQALNAQAHPGPWPPGEIVRWLPETIAALVDAR